MEGGCLEHPAAVIAASHFLDRIPPQWLANSHNPAVSPHSTPGTCHTDWISERKERGEKSSVGKMLKKTATQTAIT